MRSGHFNRRVGLRLARFKRYLYGVPSEYLGTKEASWAMYVPGESPSLGLYFPVLVVG